MLVPYPTDFDVEQERRDARFNAAVQRIDPAEMIQDSIDSTRVHDALARLATHIKANPPGDDFYTRWYVPTQPPDEVRRQVLYELMLSLERSCMEMIRQELERGDVD